MRSIRRAAVCGGFGIVAMAGVASSVAFACTPFAQLKVNGQSAAIVSTINETLRVEATRFDPNHGAVRFSWGGDSPDVWRTGKVLGIVETPGEVPSTSSAGGTQLAWSTDIVVPADATDGRWAVVAWQYNTYGNDVFGNAAVYVDIVNGAPMQRTGSTTDPVKEMVAESATGGDRNADRPQLGTAGGTDANDSKASIAVGAVASSGSAATVLGTSGPSGQPTAQAPAGADTAPATGDVDRAIPVPGPNDIWSGLHSSGPTRSLLDASGPASGAGTSPAGVALLGLGVVALAGTAAAAGWRRVATARAARS